MRGTEIGSIKVGHVSTRKGARLHLATDGAAPCGSGTRTIRDARIMVSGDVPMICKRCQVAIRNLASQAADRMERQSGARWSTAMREAIDAARDAADRLITAREAQWREDMVASLVADLSMANVNHDGRNSDMGTSDVGELTLF